MFRHPSAVTRAYAALALAAVAVIGCAGGSRSAPFVPPSRPAEFSLAGIPWGISADSLTELMGPRGYNYNKTDGEGDMLFDGVLFRTPTRIFAFMAQQKLTKFRVVMNTPDEKAIAMYQQTRAELVKQYGPPKETMEEYEPPYAKGDGKQQQAFRDKKALLRTYWLPSGSRTTLVSVQVSSNLAVLVDYESAAWDRESVRRRQGGR